MADFDLTEPTTLEEALDCLDPDDASVRPIGGGTALMLMMKAQFLEPVRLVSLRKLGEPFSGMNFDHGAGTARIGAMTTFSQLELSPEIARNFPVVTRAMPALANVRVRNVATVGGNLAHGDPHLDLPPIWAALGAEAVIVSREGSRSVAVEDISLGYYETKIADGELISHINVPLRPGWRSIYRKVTTRALHDWPALGIAISAQFENNTINDCRVVLSAAVDKPTRLLSAETLLRGRQPERQLLANVALAAVEEAQIESDSRGTGDYKNQLLRIHLVRAIEALANQASDGGYHAVA